eukprot:CAMPEP_0171631654 /NCGR_PEP_ID=MMETSP0990-20121206/23809_1 /TAXON_ID=483369 /ORGANISM="non described non described, Strain CCMP2098" /LENGTH=243 /DNA_ID=CAMNT_0012201367 /DNA_START=50 /DNA_END=781 /DNA_ORIENTATION=-
MPGQFSRLVLVLLLSSAQLAVAFAPPRRFNAVTIAKASRCETGASVFASRRDVLSGLGIAAGWIGGTAAWAAEEDEANAEPVYNDIPLSREKMGGLLEPYADVSKGWRIMKPYSWNQFEQKPGVYEMKWVDIVAANKQEMFLTTAPVKSTTSSVASLGDVKQVGAKLASARSAVLVSAEAVSKEGIVFYMFEFKNEETAMRELYQLCVAKGKLWSLDASAPEKRWAKSGVILKNALLSFIPRL